MYWVDSAGMVVGGLLAGFAFGFLLQKGNVSRYPVIVGQFLFTDYTVLKVMLTAIVVGAVGVYGMVELGVLAHLHVKPAMLLANAVGGLVFGIGMVGLGYCPGTCVAAAGEGSKHALSGLLGMVVGAMLFTELFPWLQTNVMGVADLGKVTFADLLGVSPWWFVLILAAVSGAAFAAIGRWERTVAS